MFERSRFLQRYWVWITLAVILAAMTLWSLYFWLEFTVLQTMYLAKAGLNWFAIHFYKGYTFLFAALLALLTLNPLPGRSDLYEAVNAFRQLMKVRMPSTPTYTYRRPPIRAPQITIPKIAFKRTKLTWAFWQAAKWFAAFTIISMLQEVPLIGPFSTVFYMTVKGFGKWTSIPRIFILAIHPASGEELVELMPTMEIQYRLLYILLLTVVATIVVRLLLKALRDYSYGKPTTWIRNIFISLTLGTFAFIFDSPYWRMDITTPYFYFICLILLFCFLALSIIFHYGGFSLRVTLVKRRNIVVTAVIVGLIALLAVNSGIIAVFRFNWNNNWPTYEWTPFTSKQISVTRWTAGIEDIVTQPITEAPAGNETKTLDLVRQWDQSSAKTRMINQIGVNWMTLTLPDIIYVYNKEYWVAPTTIKYPTVDWISRNLIYTHASKIFAIDSHTGDFVPITEVFRLSREPLIYYGEQFYETVYPNVRGFNEIENISYRGDPDYVLSGWQRMLWFLAQGQFGFAFAPPQNSIEMLYKRDVLQRVQEVLLSGLKVDPDAYLVTHDDELYYAVQVYVDYPLNSRFAAEPYLRFFAVVLVNVENGEMEGYAVGEDDFLVSFYKEYYPNWGPPPDWLVSQLRYPEALLGSVVHDIEGQLDVDFFFHVEDPFDWRSGSEFYERPPGTEVHYILLTEGEEVYFVGIQLVEFLGSEGKNLAGMYIVQGSSRLGEVHLFKAPLAGNVTSLVGPTAAVNAFQTNSEVREKLTLLGANNFQLGNILLYMIGQRLYYFIPVYITPGGVGVITKMPFIGVVDAVTREVAIGSNSASAFYTLTGQTPSEQPGEEDRIRDTYMAFVNRGYIPINATHVDPDVSILVANASYLSAQDWEAVNSTIASFISNYVEIYSERGVYRWMSGGNTLNYGVFEVFPDGFTRLYYISIKYR